MLRPNPIFENLELLARQAVEGYIIGLHKSPFHGFSVEFAEHRLYNHGDALKHVDWRVFGRTEKLFIKRYEEETNLRCCIAMDTSSSMNFPEDAQQSKLQYAVFAAACIIQLLKRQLDAASVALFDEQIHYLSECRSTHSHYRLLTTKLEQLITSKTPVLNKATQAAAALHEIAEKMHRRSLIVIFSDMMDDPGNTEAIFNALQHLKYNKHEVILFHLIEKSKEAEFEFENRPYEFIDMETKEKIRLQPHQVKESYQQQMQQFLAAIETRCHQYKIDYVALDLKAPVEKILHQYLIKRGKLM